MTTYFFTPTFALGHILPPVGGSAGRGDLKLTPMGVCPPAALKWLPIPVTATTVLSFSNEMARSTQRAGRCLCS